MCGAARSMDERRNRRSRHFFSHFRAVAGRTYGRLRTSAGRAARTSVMQMAQLHSPQLCSVASKSRSADRRLSKEPAASSPPSPVSTAGVAKCRPKKDSSRSPIERLPTSASLSTGLPPALSPAARLPVAPANNRKVATGYPAARSNLHCQCLASPVHG